MGGVVVVTHLLPALHLTGEVESLEVVIPV